MGTLRNDMGCLIAAARKRTLEVAKLLLMRTRHLSWLVIVATLAVSTASAKPQPENVAKLKTDARNAVGIIGSDKAKTQTYCQIIALERQFIQAVSEKDRRKAEALGRQIDQFRKQLPEAVVLANITRRVDRNSPDGQDIEAIIQSLNQSCPE